MLSRNAKKILKLAKKNAERKISYDELKKTLGWDYSRIHSACDQLIEQNLAKEKAGIQFPGRVSSPPWGITLSEKGRNRFPYVSEKVSLFLLTHIFLPIAVSAITAYITAIITLALTE